jgi:FMN phosphatase YigB (HAD superfamily)
MPNFRNLIFDLGNVIIDIDYARPIAGFQQLVAPGSGFHFESIVSYQAQLRLFDLFETGRLSEEEFRSEIRKFLKPEVSDQEIDGIWNSILVAYPVVKFELLLRLKERYRILALSNTNSIHAAALDVAARQKLGAQRFSDFFHQVYYSHLLGFRKPEKAIYEHVATLENLNPAETFFVDDKQENVQAALDLGWQAYHLTERDKLIQLLTELSII